MTLTTAVQALRDAWPREDFPDRTIALYADRLTRFPENLVEQAVDDMILTQKFRPSIGMLAEAVAERALNLPTAEEAWTIAERGSLRDAHEAVRESAEFVGGRWAILHSDNITTVRAQFTKAYNSLRQRALNDYATGGRPALPGREPRVLGPTMAALPESTRVHPRPVMARLSARWAGRDLPPPTEEEKADAIAVLRDFDQVWVDDPADDPLYSEAERIFEEAGR